MKIGIPKEIKIKENRVSCTPGGVFELVRNGHQVFVETGAGAGSGYADERYRQAGATLVGAADEAWESHHSRSRLGEDAISGHFPAPERAHALQQ
jgi:alanine dehydrogenase